MYKHYFYMFCLGFDGTSNVLAGKLFGIPIKGTMAHAFVSSFNSKGFIDSIDKLQPADANQEPRDLLAESKQWLKKIAPILGVFEEEVKQGELASFVAYATAFPCSFLALVDTYHVLRYVICITRHVNYSSLHPILCNDGIPFSSLFYTLFD